MSNKANWLNPADIHLIQPKTADEVEALRDDINLVCRHFGDWEEDTVDWMKQCPHYLTLVYVDDQPAGCIWLPDAEGYPGEIGKKSLEFGGAVLPEYRDKGLTQQVAPIVLNRAFRPGKKKILAKVGQDNQEAIMALNGLGFKFAGVDPENKDVRIYRLTKEDSDAYILSAKH